MRCNFKKKREKISYESHNLVLLNIIYIDKKRRSTAYLMAFPKKRRSLCITLCSELGQGRGRTPFVCISRDCELTNQQLLTFILLGVK